LEAALIKIKQHSKILIRPRIGLIKTILPKNFIYLPKINFKRFEVKKIARLLDFMEPKIL
jgi:hypothetical protein